MNLQECEQPPRSLQQVTQAQAGQKDAGADALIRDAAAQQPATRTIPAMRHDFALSAAGNMAAG